MIHDYIKKERNSVKMNSNDVGNSHRLFYRPRCRGPLDLPLTRHPASGDGEWHRLRDEYEVGLAGTLHKAIER